MDNSHNDYDDYLVFLQENDISPICNPFFKVTGLNFFNYAKLHDNNYIVSLTSNIELMEYACRLELRYLMQPGIYLWETIYPENLVVYARNSLNHAYGIIIVQRSGEYMESFCFAAPRNRQDILTLYFNNYDIIQNFIFFFKEKAQAALRRSESKRFYLGKKFQYTLEDAIDENVKQTILQEFQPNKYFLDTKAGQIILTKRNVDCIRHLLQGKSAKETAKILKISHRTVESYLDVIKLKFNCCNRPELVSYIMFHHPELCISSGTQKMTGGLII